jgi:membrane protein
MPGLLMVVTAVAALAFDRKQVEGNIMQNITVLLGPDVARATADIVANTQREGRGFWSIILGAVTLLFGATGLFIHLQSSLNAMWGVKVKASVDWWAFLRNRLTALGLMAMIGFLLLMSMSLTAFVTVISEPLAARFPVYTVFLMHIINFLLSLGIISFLFALMFKMLPDIRLKWRYALSGGLASAFLFMAGEYMLTVYFAVARPGSAFGAAGSIVLFMLWIFYACLIFFFGATFTRIHSAEADQGVKPAEIAKKGH